MEVIKQALNKGSANHEGNDICVSTGDDNTMLHRPEAPTLFKQAIVARNLVVFQQGVGCRICVTVGLPAWLCEETMCCQPDAQCDCKRSRLIFIASLVLQFRGSRLLFEKRCKMALLFPLGKANLVLAAKRCPQDRED